MRLAILALALAAPVAAETVDVPVLVRTVERGEALSPADFTVEAMASGYARDALQPEETKGMEARRRLSAGAPVRASDLVRVQLVRRGEPVTIAVRSGALSIKAPGRALSGGAEGELVRVVSTATGRTLDGVVEGSGSVRIAAP